MANFYTDTPQFRHYLNHPLMKRIVELKERNYVDKHTYDYAPMDFEDAMDSYDRILEVVGEICGEIIAPNAERVDHTGPTVSNGRVTYASPTQENLNAPLLTVPSAFIASFPTLRVSGTCFANTIMLNAISYIFLC
jgi:hypothetical protein